jgi:hypothetical protein
MFNAGKEPPSVCAYVRAVHADLSYAKVLV